MREALAGRRRLLMLLVIVLVVWLLESVAAGQVYYGGSVYGGCRPGSSCYVPRSTTPAARPSTRTQTTQQQTQTRLVPVEPVASDRDRPEGCPEACQKQIAALESRLDRIEARLKALEQADNLTVSEYERREKSLIGGLESRLKTLEANPTRATLPLARWEAFGERLRALEERPSWFGLQVTDPLTGHQASPQRIELGTYWELYLPPSFTVRPDPPTGTE